MSPLDTLAETLKALGAATDRPELEPDAARRDFESHRPALEALRAQAEDGLLVPVEAAVADLSQPERERVRDIVAGAVGGAAAALGAAHWTGDAGRLLGRAASVAGTEAMRNRLLAGAAHL